MWCWRTTGLASRSGGSDAQRVRDAVHVSQERRPAADLVLSYQLVDHVLEHLPARVTKPEAQSSTPPGRCSTPTSGARRSRMRLARRCSSHRGMSMSSTTSRRRVGGPRVDEVSCRGRFRAALPGRAMSWVVNNGAAALLLAITVLAAGREVVWSCGELVEIGAAGRSRVLPERLVLARRYCGFRRRPGDDNPIISGADLSVGAAVSEEFALAPARDVGRRPAEVSGFFVKRCGFMMEIFGVSRQPRRIRSAALPTGTPYMRMFAPGARSSVANLCFAGISDSDVWVCESKTICSPLRRSASAISKLSCQSSLSPLFGIIVEPVLLRFVRACARAAGCGRSCHRISR